MADEQAAQAPETVAAPLPASASDKPDPWARLSARQSAVAEQAPEPSAPSETAKPSPAPVGEDEYAALRASLNGLPRDVAARFLDEVEPLKAERDAHAQRAQAQREQRLKKEWQQEQEQARQRDAELSQLKLDRERQFDLAKRAKEGDWDAREALVNEVLPYFDRELLASDPDLEARFREKLKDDPDLAAYHGAQALGGVFGGIAQHPRVAALAEDRRDALFASPDPVQFVEQLGALFSEGLVPEKELDARIEAAVLADRDKRRLAERSPDTGPNAAGATASTGRLTLAQLRQMSPQERLNNVDLIRSSWLELAGSRE